VFVGVCIISAIFGIADANCQGALVGDLSLMCPEFVQVTSHILFSVFCGAAIELNFICRSGSVFFFFRFQRPYFILYCALSFQSFMAGLAASGVLTSALRLITKAAFESSKDGLRIGASKSESCETFADLVTSYFHI